MYRIIGIILALNLLACKAESNQKTTGIEPTVSSEVATQEPENIKEVVVAKSDPLENVREEQSGEDKPEKAPVFVEPKPKPTSKAKGNTKPTSEENVISIDQQSDKNAEVKEQKPENPPVFVEAKPRPSSNENANSQEVLLHHNFDKLLKEYVSSNGKVNYSRLKSNITSLNEYLEALSSNPPNDNWSNNKRLAYWINAYNAFTIKKILDNYPVKSITDLDNGKPWDVKWIKIGKETYSLNNIENDIIRPQFKDARIHFAVNCAAKSCPPLLNKAYTESNVNTLLNSQTSKFINNPNFNKLEGSTISISKIFDWYKVDFGDIKVFLNKYAKTKIKQDAKIEFMEYNWALNN